MEAVNSKFIVFGSYESSQKVPVISCKTSISILNDSKEYYLLDQMEFLKG